MDWVAITVEMSFLNFDKCGVFGKHSFSIDGVGNDQKEQSFKSMLIGLSFGIKPSMKFALY